MSVRSNSFYSSGFKSHLGNYPFSLVVRRSGVQVIGGHEFLTTKP